MIRAHRIPTRRSFPRTPMVICLFVVAFLAAWLLSGCYNDKAVVLHDYDQCVRREIFKQCVASIAAANHGKPVEECDEVAFSQSWRPTALIAAECK